MSVRKPAGRDRRLRVCRSGQPAGWPLFALSTGHDALAQQPQTGILLHTLHKC